MGDAMKQPDYRARLKEAVVALQKMRAKLESVAQARIEPVAIIGIGCRYPGHVDTPDAFWQLLRDGVDAIGEIPRSRWDADAYYDPDPAAPGKMNTRWGGFLQDVERFDPRFFGIAPVEARSMDPQQRLLLEVTWEALERAGRAPRQLSGSRTGVFVGVTFNDYLQLLDRESQGVMVNPYRLTGNMMNAIAGRISYIFGFQGPCLTLDTACSSSLVSVHLACQSLRLAESDLAVAGGVNLILSPEWMITASKNKMLSPDGRCKAFDSRADGFVRSEGCGMVVLKRLSDAVAEGDPILAVIRGSAVNQDGFSSGFTVPNRRAQEKVISGALQAARVAPADVDYVEAHGTGTSLGDPIEVRALTAVFGAERSADNPFLLGSVKTNIGHTEAAAGVAGLIKVVLSLQHEVVPPHLHLQQPNPHILWEQAPIRIPTELTPWPRGEKARIAGISSFGASGVNAHIVVAEAPATEPAPAVPERPAHLLTLSAQNEAALAELAGRYRDYLAANPSAPLADICFTANNGRSHFAHRLALSAASLDETAAALQAYLAGRESAGVIARQAPRGDRGKIAFLFTGQGSQYAGMGRELYQTQPLFRATIDECAALLEPQMDRPLHELLYPETAAGEASASRIDQTAYTQPALFAVEYALARLWQSWGVQPEVVLGHSIGEFVAACVAGLFSLADGLKLVAARGRLMQALAERGVMAVVFAGEEQVQAAVAADEGEVGIAAVNGPANVTISGRCAAVAAVCQRLAQAGIECRELSVSHAFHSSLMEPMLADFAEVAGTVAFSPPRLDMVSNVSGRLAGEEVATANYWVEHVRRPVRFAEGMAALAASGVTTFIEVGPKPTLLSMGRHCVAAESQALWLPSLRPKRGERPYGRGEWRQMLESLGALYAHGLELDLAGVDRGFSRRRLPLPTYPFQRQRYWVKPAPARSYATDGVTAAPLLGRRLHLPGSSEIRFETVLDVHSPPHMTDHQVFGATVVPGAAYASLALSAAKETYGADACVLEDLFFPKALTLREGRPVLAQLILTPDEEGNASFQVMSGPQDGELHAAESWQLHAAGKMRSGASEATAAVDIDSIRARCSRELSGASFYDAFWAAGYHLGSAFQWLDHIWQGEHETLCRLQQPSLPDDVAGYQLYPGLIDSFWQSLLSCSELDSATLVREGYLYIPFHVTSFHFYRRPQPGSALWCHTMLRDAAEWSDVGPVGDIRLLDAGGQPIAEVRGLQLTRARVEDLAKADNGQDPAEWLYEVVWQERPQEMTAESVAAGANWLILADEGGVGQALAARLRNAGQRCTLARPGAGYMERGDEITLDICDAEQYRRLLATAGEQLQGIVHLWGADARWPSDVDQLQQAQMVGCGSVLHLLQALDGAPPAADVRLWLATRGAQPVAGARELQVAYASLWGLGRVIALEQPTRWGALVDLAPHENAEADAAQLLRTLLQPDGENQIAFRDGVRFVPRLQRQQVALDEQLAVRKRGSYLITGGLGSLGLQVARWLAAQGAQRLVLTGRSGASAEQQAAIEELRAQGARVEVLAADVAQADDVERLLQAVRAEQPPLCGIVHAAGVVDDGILLHQSWPRFERVLAAKVAGAWNLHCQSQDDPLDFFVTFSSATAVLGWPGQSNYAAANAFLDALAHQRRATGLPALSVNWAPWAESGMATRVGAAGQERWQTFGIGAITPEQGLQSLSALLAAGAAQTLVLPIQWSRYRQQFTAFKEPSLVRSLTGRAVAQPPAARLALRAELEAASLRERQKLLLYQLRMQAARVLGLASPEQVGMQQGFFTLGMDSLMAMDLRNRLQDDLEVTLPATLFFKYPTVEELSEYLVRDVLAELFPIESGAPAATTEHASSEATLDDLSQDDIAGLLAQELAAVKAETVS